MLRKALTGAILLAALAALPGCVIYDPGYYPHHRAYYYDTYYYPYYWYAPFWFGGHYYRGYYGGDHDSHGFRGGEGRGGHR